MSEHEEYDELNIDTEIQIIDGEIIAVLYKGNPIRARVIDYDVQFPQPAGSVKVDEDGDYYLETIV